MNDRLKQESVSIFDVTTGFVCLGSLVGSLFAGMLIVPSIHGGFYFGTALMLYLLLSLQLIAFLAAVGAPTLVLFLRRRFQLSRRSLWLLVLALLALVGEALAAWLIPITGNC